jgi:hypothetical protein
MKRSNTKPESLRRYFMVFYITGKGIDGFYIIIPLCPSYPDSSSIKAFKLDSGRVLGGASWLKVGLQAQLSVVIVDI